MRLQRIVVLSSVDSHSRLTFLRALADYLSDKSKNVIIVDLSADKYFSEILLSEPESSHDFKTRVPRINRLKCKFCGRCAAFCSQNVLSFERSSSRVVIDSYRCIDCGECYRSCNLKGALVPTDFTAGTFSVFNFSSSIQIIRSSFRRRHHLMILGKPWLEEFSADNALIIDLDPNLWGKSWIANESVSILLSNGLDQNEKSRLIEADYYLTIGNEIGALPLASHSDSFESIDTAREYVIYKEAISHLLGK